MDVEFQLISALEVRYAHQDGLAAGDVPTTTIKEAWLNSEQQMAAQFDDIAKHGFVEVRTTYFVSADFFFFQ